MAFSQAHKKASDNYRAKALANITVIISHTEPEVLDALNEIMAQNGSSKAMAIKTALVEYAKILKQNPPS